MRRNPLEPADTGSDALAKYKAYTATRDKIKAAITTLRERVTYFNLPYLSLPADTSKDVALQVFINMNTNSKPLSMYDIIVAEVESVAERSLHALEASLTDKCPKAARFGNVSDLILSTSALLQEKLPNTCGMIEMDKKLLLENWPKLERGLERMASFLEGQHVFDEARLPTNAVLAVIAAAYELIPDHGDFLAKAEKLLRRYLWSPFLLIVMRTRLPRALLPTLRQSKRCSRDKGLPRPKLTQCQRSTVLSFHWLMSIH